MLILSHKKMYITTYGPICRLHGAHTGICYILSMSLAYESLLKGFPISLDSNAESASKIEIAYTFKRHCTGFQIQYDFAVGVVVNAYSVAAADDSPFDVCNVRYIY